MEKEEAIKILREVHDNALFSVRNALETLIPELKESESEDERIRKWLLGICKNMAHACRLDLAIDTEDAELKKELANYEASILYLEKHKVNTEGDFARGYDCGYKCCLNSHGAEWFEKQKEQKPAEWSEEDEAKLEDVLYWFEIFCYKNQSKPEMRESLNWLKSLPMKYQKKSDNWKPSEEQMGSLRLAIDSANKAQMNATADTLNEIYEQLKKL